MAIAIKLEREIAEQIVQRTMQIIELNINVMDEHGVIIASGDPTRIGQSHDGALLAIAKGDTVSLDQGAANQLSGVKPGVNLLLHFNHQVLGVIGITGAPVNVVQYGRLVKMAAELIIEQSNALQQHQWGYRQREEFVVQWAQGSTQWSVLQDWAQRLQIDLTVPRTASVIEIRSEEPLKQQAMREVIELLEYPRRDNLVAMFSLNEIIVLKPYRSDEREEQRRVASLLARADNVAGVDLVIAVGPYFIDPLRLADSFQCARLTLAIGKRQQPKQRQFYYADYQLSVLLSQLSKDWRHEALIEPFSQLKKQDNNGVLTKTLHQYFQDFPDQKACAAHLHIHRNSLRYRLLKIEKITGCSLQNIDSLTRLYVASTLTV